MLKAKNAAMMDSRDSGGSHHGFSNNRQLSGERMSDIGDLHSLQSINEDEVFLLPCSRVKIVFNSNTQSLSRLS